MKVNITLKIEQELLREARLLAAQEETSLSAWFGQQLERMLRHRKGYEGARQRALARLKKEMKLGWHRPNTRGEVYER